MKKILINALYPEEKRVAIVEDDRLVDFYVELSSKELLKGNIYKGTISRIEPGLQAVFVDFGPKKHGFLQMREIQPEYFQNKKQGKKARVQDVLVKGQEIIVQVEKDERDTKGASLTTYISIPGRYIVMMPGQTRVGISRKIESREDRDRLKETFGSLKLPPNMGFILRTACSDRTKEEFSNDLKYLTKLWNKIQTESKKASAPALIYKEQDIAVRTVRDYLTSDVSEVLVDDEKAYRNTKEFLRKTLPWRKINIKYYKEKKPIFSLHNIEEQVTKLNERFVSLPSRGYLVFDKTEALTAIDVNSGKSRREENIESTALKTNLEAAEEIARQLRLRDIGGLVVIDFIDMESSKNRREVENSLKSAMSTDKAHMEITGISKFGIVEMTRERMRPNYADSMNKKCPFCSGAGFTKSEETVAIAALRDIHTKASKGNIKSIACRLPVESANYLINTRRDDIVSLEKDFALKITVLGDNKLLPGQSTIEAEGPEDQNKAAAKGKGNEARTGEAKVNEAKEGEAQEGEGKKSESKSRGKRSRSRRNRNKRKTSEGNEPGGSTPGESGAGGNEPEGNGAGDNGSVSNEPEESERGEHRPEGNESEKPNPEGTEEPAPNPPTLF
ncbi:MAG TPA: Rne/Rng family ribonuclease [Dissulfurispiraceae bacterium]